MNLQVTEVPDPAELYDKLIKLLIKFADHGVIHGDFNEFNIMLGRYQKWHKNRASRIHIIALDT